MLPTAADDVDVFPVEYGTDSDGCCETIDIDGVSNELCVKCAQ